MRANLFVILPLHCSHSEFLLVVLSSPSSCNKICQNLSRLSAISSSIRGSNSSSSSDNNLATTATSATARQQHQQTHQQHLAHTKWAQQQHHHAHYQMIINLVYNRLILGPKELAHDLIAATVHEMLHS
uniref:HDC17859 n=1 Tax=Drosophila melanogaster TaxID=7227 RepID=Q6IIJ7_DROME|nr:TPA_inf: HDC17859 [Drosophila melanogaster]